MMMMITEAPKLAGGDRLRKSIILAHNHSADEL
jgi:hypothetical protein